LVVFPDGHKEPISGAAMYLKTDSLFVRLRESSDMQLGAPGRSKERKGYETHFKYSKAPSPVTGEQSSSEEAAYGTNGGGASGRAAAAGEAGARSQSPSEEAAYGKKVCVDSNLPGHSYPAKTAYELTSLTKKPRENSKTLISLTQRSLRTAFSID
jgi:hypothetical protein